MKTANNANTIPRSTQRLIGAGTFAVGALFTLGAVFIGPSNDAASDRASHEQSFVQAAPDSEPPSNVEAFVVGGIGVFVAVFGLYIAFSRKRWKVDDDTIVSM